MYTCLSDHQTVAMGVAIDCWRQTLFDVSSHRILQVRAKGHDLLGKRCGLVRERVWLVEWGWGYVGQV